MFPSNKYTKELQRGSAGIEEINQWGLFFEYLMLNFGHEGLGRSSVITMMFDQMKNMYLFFLLKARTYLVNVVFDTDNPATRAELIGVPPTEPDLDARTTAACWVGLTYILPMLFLHIWDISKVKMDLEGRSRVFLQTSIFRKYLNYSEQSRSKVRVSHMQVAIMNNTADLAKAYVNVLEMMQMLGKIVLLVFFMLTQDPQALPILALIPALMVVFGWARSDRLSKASEYAGPLKKVLIDLTCETCAKYRLIADYSQRAQMNELFSQRASELRRSLIPEKEVELNNNYFPMWLSPLFTGGYIAFAARMVLTGELSLGVFLATLSVFNEVCGDFSGLYRHIMDINTKLDSLKTLTKYFNMETEVLVLKDLCEHRRKWTQDAVAKVIQQLPPPDASGLLRSDLIPISLNHVTFGYSDGSGGSVLQDVCLSVPQGKMVAVVGTPGSGKASFMRLLAQTIFPVSGHIEIAQHLRVLFVAQLPVLFDQSPWKNIAFGRPDLKDVEIAHSILKELHMPQTLELLKTDVDAKRARSNWRGEATGEERGGPLADANAAKGGENGDYIALQSADTARDDSRIAVDDDMEADEKTTLLASCCSADTELEGVEIYDDFSWQERLSFTEQVKLCLARALLMNPEVLVLHRPFHNYDAPAQKLVARVLRDHMANRGLCLPAETWAERRPRTLFFTPESVVQAQLADVIWQIDPVSASVYEISPQELRPDFCTSENAQMVAKLREQWQSPHAKGG
uniref:ABC transporter domain-containing protein n=1 Tax=Zooxanthella nutricula TaxID=1333877 RepID=A0A7S2KED4_9DINO